jgi:nicotinamidase/pyrazinamidase
VTDKDALIIVDLQNDFIPSGALAVNHGDEIIEPINSLAEKFHDRGNIIVMTQDWHPPGHLSFASSHDKKPFEPYESEGIGPVLWPDHCVQGSRGAEFHPDVETRFAKAIIRKGCNPKVDSYSVFIENDMKTYTGASGYLKTLGRTRIFICGLALDYCVYYSTKDGRDLGFEIVIPIDLSKAIDSPQDHLSNALDLMVKKGARFVKSENIVV